MADIDPFAADLAAKGAPAGDDPFAADLAAKQAAPAVQSAPAAETSAWQRVKDSFSRMGSTMASGASAVGTSLRHPIDTFTDPARRRELERGLSDMTTFGLAEKAARAIDPEHFGDEQAAKDAAAAPGFRAGGNLAGAFLPSPASWLGGAAAKAVPGKGILAGAARGAAAYEAAAPLTAAVQAPEGHRLDAAVDAATDPAGLALGASVGAAAEAAPRAKSIIAERAQRRMADQAIKDIAGGKETGLSKPTDRRLIARQADTLREEFRDPAAVKIADTARKDPAAAWEMVQKRVDDITSSRRASYAAIDNSTGGVRISDLRQYLANEVSRLGKDPGQATERAAVENMIGDIDHTWGQQLAPTVPTIKMRQYVTRLQRVAADTMGGIEETRRMQILEHVSGLAKDFLDQHLDAARKADPALSPVVDGLKEQNRRTAAWLSLEDALKTRASKLETNRMVDNKPATLAAGAGAAAAAQHFLHSPGAAAVAAAAGAAPYVIPPVDRAVTRAAARMQPGATANPASVARLIQLARSGATRPQLQAQAQADGTPPEIAANIAQQFGR